MAIYSAVLSPQGFGMWQKGEEVLVEYCDTLDDYESMLADVDCDYEQTDEINGQIYEQNNGIVYKITNPNGISQYEVVYEQ